MIAVLRYFLFTIGILISIPIVFMLFLLPNTPISFVGVLYLFSVLAINIAMLVSPWRPQWSVRVILAGTVLILFTITTRVIFPPTGSQIKIITLPSKSEVRLLNRIFNEQDVVFFGTQALAHLGGISPIEENSLLPAFSRVYDEMRKGEGSPLSPFLMTYLNQQTPNQFDVVIVEPNIEKSPEAGIIFLHGAGGNFTLQCWLIGKASSSIDLITVCPSTSPSGYWWTSTSEVILQETVNYLHDRGVERIYLAGLSNGGVGASQLANHFKDSLDGLILISGANPYTEITELPVLVIHGRYDERIKTPLIEQYVSATGAESTFYLFEGDHFLLLKKADQVQAIIIDWLIEQESRTNHD